MRKYLLSFFFCLLLMVPFITVFAAGDATTPCASSSICLSNPLGSSIGTPQLLIGKAINAVLGIVGSLALVMFIYGGLTWMTSSGSEEKVKKGKEIIVWSAIGLVVIFMSYALVRFVLSTISSK